MIQDIDGTKFQLARLAGLRGYPKDPVARGELVRVACATASALDDVRKAVETVVNDWERCPVPSELRKLIFECQPPAPKRYCIACEGVGFIVSPYLITRERDQITGRMGKTVQKITRAEERELQPKLSDLYHGAALADQEILDAAEKCGCRA
jgi:hypothetical protein